MTVLVANDVPPAIRGLLKRWFIEPKPNVFVGTVNRRTREKTLEYIRRNAPEMGMLMIASAPRTAQGFEIHAWGPADRIVADFCGLQLIAEAWSDTEPVGEGSQTEACLDIIAKARIDGSLTTL